MRAQRILDSELPSHLKLTLLTLSTFADTDGGSIFPTIKRIGWLMSISERQARTNVTELQRLGLVVAETPRTGGRKLTTMWRLHLDQLPTRAPFWPDGTARRSTVKPGSPLPGFQPPTTVKPGSPLPGFHDETRKPTSAKPGSPLPPICTVIHPVQIRTPRTPLDKRGGALEIAVSTRPPTREERTWAKTYRTEHGGGRCPHEDRCEHPEQCIGLLVQHRREVVAVGQAKAQPPALPKAAAKPPSPTPRAARDAGVH